MGVFINGKNDIDISWNDTTLLPHDDIFWMTITGRNDLYRFSEDIYEVCQMTRLRNDCDVIDLEDLSSFKENVKQFSYLYISSGASFNHAKDLALRIKDKIENFPQDHKIANLHDNLIPVFKSFNQSLETFTEKEFDALMRRMYVNQFEVVIGRAEDTDLRIRTLIEKIGTQGLIIEKGWNNFFIGYGIKLLYQYDLVKIFHPRRFGSGEFTYYDIQNPVFQLTRSGLYFHKQFQEKAYEIWKS